MSVVSRQTEKKIESESFRPGEFRGGITSYFSVYEGVQYLTEASEVAAK